MAKYTKQVLWGERSRIKIKIIFTKGTGKGGGGKGGNTEIFIETTHKGGEKKLKVL
jgi:hypothetical protein